MRDVRLSLTFNDQLNELLAQGEDRFGAAVADEKRKLVYSCIRTFLASHPDTTRPHRRLGLVAYPVNDTPFMLLYDFDDTELRVHFIVHRNTDLRNVDLASVEW
jgi:plasmid stabilization system protein ParE